MKQRVENRNFFGVWILAVGIFALALQANAFVGPSAGCTPGGSNCGGYFALDANRNIGFGTQGTVSGTGHATPPAGSFRNIFMLAATSSPPGIALRNLGTGNISGAPTSTLKDASYVLQMTPWGGFAISDVSASAVGSRDKIVIHSGINRIGIASSTIPTHTLQVFGSFKSDTLTSAIDPADFIANSPFAAGSYAVNGTLSVGTSTVSATPSNGLFVAGNVGVGVASPNFALHVNGNVHATGTISATSATLTGLTSGSVLFAGAGGSVSQSNATLYWDNSNGRLGVGTSTPNTAGYSSRVITLEHNGGGAVELTASRADAADASMGLFGWSMNTNSGAGASTANKQLAVIEGYTEGTTANNRGGRIIFRVRANGAANGTGAVEKMRLDSNGNVGIGTASPTSTLAVAGNISVNNNRIINLATPVDNADAATKNYVDSTFGGGSSTSSFATLTVSATTTLATGGTANVGIGTTNPGSLLEMVGTAPKLTIDRTSGGGNWATLQWQISNVNKGYMSLDDNADWHIRNTANTDFLFLQDSTGNVGIGTASPGSKLDVAGSPMISGSFQNSSSGIVGVVGDTYTANDVVALDFRPSDQGNDAMGRIGMEMTASGSYLRFGTSNNYASGITNTAMTIDYSGNVGIATTNPTSTLTVSGQLSMLNNRITNVATPISNSDSATKSYVDSVAGSGLTGTGAASYIAKWTGTGSFGTSTLYESSGNVGIGQTSPGAKLDIGGSAQMAPHLGVRKSGGPGIEFGHTNSAGYGSSIGATEPSGKPYLAFNAESEASGDTYRTRGKVGLIIESDLSGGLQFGRATSSSATSQPLTVDMILKNGNVGIATTNPTSTLTVSGQLSMLNNRITNVATPISNSDSATKSYVDSTVTGGSAIAAACNADATCEMNGANLNNGNISGVNKLSVQTIDPVYEINGRKYATYVADTIGLKMELSGKATLQKSASAGSQTSQTLPAPADAKLPPYSASLDLARAPEGSDLWLFWQAIDEGRDMDDIVVLLTPEFNGRVWYEKDPGGNLITIFGSPASLAHSSKSLAVSYRLSAPRHDAKVWPTVLPINHPETGTVLRAKD